MHTNSQSITLEPVDHHRLAILCGQLDEHLRLMEKTLCVEIHNRGNNFQVIGDASSTAKAHAVLLSLYAATKEGDLTPEQVQLGITEIMATSEEINDQNTSTIRTLKTQVRTRNAAQYQYISNIKKYDINFGVGPAGTGKTYLAVACAVEALEKEKVQRLILVRPAVEAGEQLGFLPGDLAQKIDPYLRPLYDALYEMLGFDRVAKLIDRNIIEIAPLAYMRGRTLNDAFIILDEAQNTTIEQMKMFLTRIGFGSTVVITGDITQTDLPRDRLSGLRHVIDVLKDVEQISFTFFSARNIVRHQLIQHIVEAYDAAEKKGAH